MHTQCWKEQSSGDKVTLPTLRSCVKLDRQPYERRLPLTRRQRRHQSVRTIGKLLSQIWQIVQKYLRDKFPAGEEIVQAVGTYRGAFNTVDKKHGIVVRAFRVDSSGAAPVYVVIDKILDDTEETSRQLGLEASDRARELLLQCSSAGEAFFQLQAAPGETAMGARPSPLWPLPGPEIFPRPRAPIYGSLQHVIASTTPFWSFMLVTQAWDTHLGPRKGTMERRAPGDIYKRIECHWMCRFNAWA